MHVAVIHESRFGNTRDIAQGVATHHPRAAALTGRGAR